MQDGCYENLELQTISGDGAGGRVTVVVATGERNEKVVSVCPTGSVYQQRNKHLNIKISQPDPPGFPIKVPSKVLHKSIVIFMFMFFSCSSNCIR